VHCLVEPLRRLCPKQLPGFLKLLLRVLRLLHWRPPDRTYSIIARSDENGELYEAIYWSSLIFLLYDDPEEGEPMQKKILDKLSIYIPETRIGQRPVERLKALGKKRDRSVNYLVVEAILEYLKREERK